MMYMAQTDLKQIHDQMAIFQKELDEFRSLFEESQFELSDEVKTQVKESRKRAHSEFKTQKEMEKKFL